MKKGLLMLLICCLALPGLSAMAENAAEAGYYAFLIPEETHGKLTLTIQGAEEAIVYEADGAALFTFYAPAGAEAAYEGGELTPITFNIDEGVEWDLSANYHGTGKLLCGYDIADGSAMVTLVEGAEAGYIRITEMSEDGTETEVSYIELTEPGLEHGVELIWGGFVEIVNGVLSING
ncbi:MAG: hypothetical protein LBN04_01590 [Oscillospiraceae bacterium]|jgi:hypothetical protein|nr:hypothetical protein [Oscillospiraceae bacterium]